MNLEAPVSMLLWYIFGFIALMTIVAISVTLISKVINKIHHDDSVCIGDPQCWEGGGEYCRCKCHRGNK